MNPPDYTKALLQQIETRHPRHHLVFERLVSHLHAFVREVEPTEKKEWLAALEFLTATGKASSDRSDEMMLFSDAMGVTMLVDAIIHQLPEGATPTTVTGPFNAEQSRGIENGARIAFG